MKALVTGAGGFVGSHLVDHLVESGYDVRAMVHYDRNGSLRCLAESSHLADLDVVAGDVCDTEWLVEAAKGCGVIYHLAAQAGLTYSFEAPDHVFAVNANGCLSALHAARRHGIRMVQMSTSEVYGTAQRTPMDENHPLSAQSPYAASKAAAEQMCLAFAHSYGVDVRVARCFNIYGPRQSERAVIPYVLTTILRAQGGRVGVPIAVPETRRDFTYVTDTVRALRLIGEAEECVTRAPINVGSGEDHSLAEIVDLAGAAVGVVAHAVADPAHARPGSSEVARLVCDRSRANLVRWQPTVSLDLGLYGVAAWLRPRLDATRAGRSV